MGTTSSSTAPVGTVQGLASNVQWQDLITQIIANETTQKLSPTTNQITADQTAVSAWSQYQGLVTTLQNAASSMSSGAFDAMQPFTATDPSGRTIASGTATSDAVPGTYEAEVLSLAQADKLGGSNITSATTNLHLSGEFFVNGTKVTVADGDTLNSIRDKINAVASGSSGTAVTASVLTVGPNANRLTLTTTQPGVGGIQLADGSTGVLAALGLVPPAGAQTTTASGGASSFRFANADTPIGTLLGTSNLPASTTLDVGNTSITVDLATDTLNSIQQKLTAAGVTSSVSTPSFNGTTMSELDINAPVAAVPGNADSQRVADLLGFTNTRGAVTQQLANTNAWTVAGGAGATASTKLTDLQIGGAPVGLAAGDSITLSGTRGDGTAVATTVTLDGTETVQTLLDKINAATAWGNSSRSGTATLGADGTLSLTDGTAGASQLSMSMVVTKAAGGTATLGQMTTQTAGYSRQIVQGTNAQVNIDGTLITRSSNTISDAIPGVTLNLSAAEPGTTSTFTVARDPSTAVTDAQSFVSAYNALVSFVQTQTAPTGELPYNTSLRASLASLTDELVQNVPGLTGDFARAGTVGLTLDQTGQLQLDTTAFQNAMTSNLAGVKALFGVTANPSNGITYLSDTENTQSGTFAVNVTSPATTATLTGSGFSGTYTDSGTPDTVTITDGSTFATGSVTLATGDDMDTIVDKFNSLFASQNMQLAAANVGGQLQITSKSYGSGAKFNIASGSGSNPTTQLGITAAQYAGTDVVGTIDGVAAVGQGQTLTGASGSAADGLSIQYSGTSAYTGQVSHTVGIGALMTNIADSITRTGNGMVANMTSSLNDEIDSLTARSTQIQSQIDAHKTALTQQFTAMESAIATLQAQTSALTSQISGLQTSAA